MRLVSLPLLRAILVAACGVLFCATAAQADNFTVNNSGWSHDAAPGNGTCADSNGNCTLNAAIEEGNVRSGSHTITFSPAVLQVTLTGTLQQLRAPFTITGNFPVRTILNGGGTFSCFDLTDSGDAPTGHAYNPMTGAGGADGSTIANMVIQNCNSHGISANGHGYTFINNFIGTNATGTGALLNKGDGISISASRVYANETNAFLQNLFGNFPGQPLDSSQITSFANQLDTLLSNAVLGPVHITNNVISGNQNNGVEVFSENLAGVFIQGNMIGTDLTGSVAVPNGRNGIRFVGSPFANVVGPGNVISGNTWNGIDLAAGGVSLPNFIMGNRIGISATLPGANIGNGLSGITVDSKPETAVNGHINPSGIALIIGPANVISDNKGGSNSADPDTFGDDHAGIIVTGTSAGVKIRGNTVGLGEFPPGTPVSSLAYGNAGDGIIVSVSEISIGGSAPSDANVIAGNTRHGIVVKSSGVTGTQILGNFIGVHPALANDLTLGNGYDGIHITAASTSFIGGAGATDFNTIAANGRNGVKLRNGGFNNGWGHLLQRNRIYGNAVNGTGVGIDLDYAEDAPNPLHGEFPNNYANLDQAQPVICTGAVGEPAACGGYAPPGDAGGTTTLDYTLTTHGAGSLPTTYRVEFFKIDAASVNAATSMTFLNEQTITADILGVLSCPGKRCTASVPAPTAGSSVVMTVTDATAITNVLGGGWLSAVKCIVFANCFVNNTSEFSNVVQPALVPVNTTTTVTNVTPGTIVYGEPVTVTATVTAASGPAPTGSVTIDAGASSCIAALGSPVLQTSTGSCQLAPAPLVAGSPYMVTATYAANAGFNGSTGGSGSLIVNKADTTTTISSHLPDPSLQGAAVVVTATVAPNAPGSGTMSGTLLVSDGVDSCMIALPATTCNLTLATAGARVLGATYGGDANFNASISSTVGHTVNPAGPTATTTAVTVAPPTSVFGQTVAATVTVTSTGQADGAVTVNAGGSSCGATLAPATMTTATASCNLAPTLPAAGAPYTVSATYSGSAGFAPSSSSGAGNASATVNKAATATSIGTHTPDPSNANAPIAVTAGVVAVVPGAGTPTGTIVVTSSPGGENCTITLPATSCNVTPAAAGAKTLTAAYSGDANFEVSASAGVGHTVNPGGATPTTTAVTLVNPATAVFGQTVAVTVAVTAGSGVVAPSGSVTVNAGASACLATLGASMTTTASGTCNLAPPPAASGSAYTVSAAYAGNATFAASSSSGAGDGTLTVNKAATTVAIGTHLPSPSNVNAPVAVTATVAVTAPGAGTPTGTITVRSDNPVTDLCAITLPATSCNITLTTTGTKTLTATYEGDANFSTSTSAGVSHQVNSGGSTPTTAAITIVQPLGSGNVTPSATAVYGQPVAVTATVTAGSGAAAPDGSITIAAGGSACVVALGSPVGTTAKGTCTLAPAVPAAASPYAVSVGYAGTATFAASNGANGSLTVNKAVTTAAIGTHTPNPSNVNAPIAVTATVAVTAPGAGTPTGVVAVSDATDNCTITLPATSCNLTPTTPGAKTLTATYNGDANFNSATSAGVAHTVNSGGIVTTTTIVSQVTPGAIVYGQAYTVTAAVTAGSGAVAPNGSVIINAGGSACVATLGSPAVLTSTATCMPLPVLPPSGGAYPVSASYGGTPTFSPSASSGGGNGTLTVGKAATATAISAHTPDPSFVFTPIQVTAGVAAAAPGAGTPTGTITVSDGTVNCVITLPATSCTLTPVTAGAKTLTATYGGDGNFNASAAPGTPHAVNLLTVFSAPTATPGVTGTVTLTGSPTCSLVNPAFVPVAQVPPAGVSFPFGLFEFQAMGCGAGGTITLQIVYSQALPLNTQYWKFGPTPGGGGNAIPHWYQLPGATANNATVTFSITDGQIGDDDLAPNGTIIDQGGPAVVSPTVIPALGDAGRLVLLLALAGLGWLALRRRRAPR
ncbi:MAG: Ig-like domain repeat protein [Betaproteobacteria bacterium]|nr:Ig-like domain repeat protein [Betaproteobacteria bacterium]